MATNYNIGKKIEDKDLVADILTMGMFEELGETTVEGERVFIQPVVFEDHRYLVTYEKSASERAEDIDLDYWMEYHILEVYAEAE